MRIGVISDTHGVLRPGVHTALAGVERIIHAGDIGSQAVLDELETIAPVTAVQGNTDAGWQLRSLPGRIVLSFGDLRILVGHTLPDLVRVGVPDDIDLVIYGHTHVAAAQEIAGRWFVNPGSASEPRDGNPPSVAVIEASGKRLTLRHRPV